MLPVWLHSVVKKSDLIFTIEDFLSETKLETFLWFSLNFVVQKSTFPNLTITQWPHRGDQSEKSVKWRKMSINPVLLLTCGLIEQSKTLMILRCSFLCVHMKMFASENIGSKSRNRSPVEGRLPLTTGEQNRTITI